MGTEEMYMVPMFMLKSSSLFIVLSSPTELAANGSLYQFLHKQKRRPTPEQTQSWPIEIAKGLKYITHACTRHMYSYNYTYVCIVMLCTATLSKLGVGYFAWLPFCISLTLLILVLAAVLYTVKKELSY